ncbi:hypothetical protein B9G69_003210 [Bdellovibrio sp. SKB1291214]|uniref:hypothetical protein n=1 Tax=Bdellovibrio sp. SKB1291214 TaxID=1732569 RepID=UPI000B519E19|nr:hypothetical protein [Bdellovibrio sp. SKB1291214]UYL09580.1 hypothetical protein B9G69_003210 [Bdellovibrio sp. SKB1291214]
MKKLIVIAATMMMGLQAQASVTASEFVSDFVNQANHRLEYINKQRTAAKKRTNYCSALDAKQVKTIQEIVAKNPEITVGDFTAQLSDSLKCFPEFWSPWSRTKTTRGMLVNTKAYIMDISLIQDVLADLNDGKLPSEHTKLLDSYNNWEWLKGAQ